MSTGAEVRVKKEKESGEGVTLGSLGTLLTSYGDSSSSDLSDEESDNANCQTDRKEVPNPLFVRPAEPLPVDNAVHKCLTDDKEIVIKREPGVDNLECGKPEDDCSMEIVKVETMCTEEEQGPSATLVDFASLNKGNKTGDGVKLELSVEDFFPSAESYTEARKVKEEVESGTSDSESDSVASSSNESEDEEGAVGGDQEKQANSKKKPEGPKVKGELGIYDLPPIEDLHISVPHEECKPIGVIKSVVDPLVIVDAHPGTPALDLDSVLFLEEGDRALGHIFDVIGPVKQPMYCVRFNSKEHIKKNKVEVGMPVYCAPKTPYTSYVFLAQLRRLKGSDASWLNDTEPPAEEVEFSDDEMEKIAKKKKRNRKFLKARATEEDAVYKEGDETNEAQLRGKKRHHHNNEQQPGFTGPAYGPRAPLNSNGRPPFMPPMVPGFTPNPYGHPPAGYPAPGPWFPPNAMQMNRYRGGFARPRGGRGFQQRFRPPVIGPSPDFSHGFQQNAYRQTSDASSWGSWCPPPQWNNQNGANFNFGQFGAAGQNPYAQMPMCNMMQQHPQPPPPPPPPPPGQ